MMKWDTESLTWVTDIANMTTANHARINAIDGILKILIVLIILLIITTAIIFFEIRKAKNKLPS